MCGGVDRLKQRKRSFKWLLLILLDALDQICEETGALDRLRIDGRREQRAEIPNVPVMQLDRGGFRFDNPINVGDPVLLIFSMRCLDEWKKSMVDMSTCYTCSKH